MDWSDLERRCHSVSPGIVAKARRGMWASAVMDLDEAGDALRPFVFLRAALEMDSDSWTELLLRYICSGEDPKTELARLNAAFPERGQCQRVWTGNHVAYRCRTCAVSESSCICADCFDEELHKGHDFWVYSGDSGGCCDCGDADAWDPATFCTRHRHLDSTFDAAGDIPDGLRTRIRTVARATLDLVAMILLCVKPSRKEEAAVVGRKAHFLLLWLMRVGQVCAGFRRVIANELMVVPGLHLPSDRDRSDIHWARLHGILGTREAGTDFAAKLLGADTGNNPHVQDIAARPLLESLLLATGTTPGEAVDGIGVLLLRTLFDPWFKAQCRISFARVYPALVGQHMQPAVEEAHEGLAQLLDRIICQLYHNGKHFTDMLDSDVDIMRNVFRILADTVVPNMVPRGDELAQRPGLTPTTPDLTAAAYTGHWFSRPLGDLRLFLLHQPCARYALRRASAGGSPAATVKPGARVLFTCCRSDGARFPIACGLVDVATRLQSMDAQLRMTAGHVAYDSTTFKQALFLSLDLAFAFTALIEGVPPMHKALEHLGDVAETFRTEEASGAAADGARLSCAHTPWLIEPTTAEEGLCAHVALVEPLLSYTMRVLLSWGKRYRVLRPPAIVALCTATEASAPFSILSSVMRQMMSAGKARMRSHTDVGAASSSAQGAQAAGRASPASDSGAEDEVPAVEASSQGTTLASPSGAQEGRWHASPGGTGVRRTRLFGRGSSVLSQLRGGSLLPTPPSASPARLAYETVEGMVMPHSSLEDPASLHWPVNRVAMQLLEPALHRAAVLAPSLPVEALLLALMDGNLTQVLRPGPVGREAAAAAQHSSTSSAGQQAVHAMALLLAEGAARTAAFVRQVHCGLWLRNGQSMHAQVWYPNSKFFQPHFVDLDYGALQLAAAALPPGAVGELVARRMGIAARLTFLPLSADDGDNDPTTIAALMKPVEECLVLLAAIVAHRPAVATSTRARARRSIRHALAMAPQAISTLQQRSVPNPEAQLEDFAGIVHSVGRRAAASAASALEDGRFTLRDAEWALVEPVWATASRNERSAMEQNLQEACSRLQRGSATPRHSAHAFPRAAYPHLTATAAHPLLALLRTAPTEQDGSGAATGAATASSTNGPQLPFLVQRAPLLPPPLAPAQHRILHAPTTLRYVLFVLLHSAQRPRSPFFSDSALASALYLLVQALHTPMDSRPQWCRRVSGVAVPQPQGEGDGEERTLAISLEGAAEACEGRPATRPGSAGEAAAQESAYAGKWVQSPEEDEEGDGGPILAPLLQGDEPASRVLATSAPVAGEGHLYEGVEADQVALLAWERSLGMNPFESCWHPLDASVVPVLATNSGLVSPVVADQRGGRLCIASLLLALTARKELAEHHLYMCQALDALCHYHEADRGELQRLSGTSARLWQGPGAEADEAAAGAAGAAGEGASSGAAAKAGTSHRERALEAMRRKQEAAMANLMGSDSDSDSDIEDGEGEGMGTPSGQQPPPKESTPQQAALAAMQARQERMLSLLDESSSDEEEEDEESDAAAGAAGSGGAKGAGADPTSPAFTPTSTPGSAWEPVHAGEAARRDVVKQCGDGEMECALCRGSYNAKAAGARAATRRPWCKASPEADSAAEEEEEEAWGMVACILPSGVNMHVGENSSRAGHAEFGGFEPAGRAAAAWNCARASAASGSATGAAGGGGESKGEAASSSSGAVAETVPSHTMVDGEGGMKSLELLRQFDRDTDVLPQVANSLSLTEQVPAHGGPSASGAEKGGEAGATGEVAAGTGQRSPRGAGSGNAVDGITWTGQSVASVARGEREMAVHAAQTEDLGTTYAAPYRYSAVVVKGCGHHTHMRCYRQFVARRRGGFDDDRQLAENEREFKCPMCRRLANTVVPLIPLQQGLGVEEPAPGADEAWRGTPSPQTQQEGKEDERDAWAREVVAGTFAATHPALRGSTGAYASSSSSSGRGGGSEMVPAPMLHASLRELTRRRVAGTERSEEEAKEEGEEEEEGRGPQSIARVLDQWAEALGTAACETPLWSDEGDTLAVKSLVPPRVSVATDELGLIVVLAAAADGLACTEIACRPTNQFTAPATPALRQQMASLPRYDARSLQLTLRAITVLVGAATQRDVDVASAALTQARAAFGGKSGREGGLVSTDASRERKRARDALSPGPTTPVGSGSGAAAAGAAEAAPQTPRSAVSAVMEAVEGAGFSSTAWGDTADAGRTRGGGGDGAALTPAAKMKRKRQRMPSDGGGTHAAPPASYEEEEEEEEEEDEKSVNMVEVEEEEEEGELLLPGMVGAVTDSTGAGSALVERIDLTRSPLLASGAGWQTRTDHLLVRAMLSVLPQHAGRLDPGERDGDLPTFSPVPLHAVPVLRAVACARRLSVRRGEGGSPHVPPTVSLASVLCQQREEVRHLAPLLAGVCALQHALHLASAACTALAGLQGDAAAAPSGTVGAAAGAADAAPSTAPSSKQGIAAVAETRAAARELVEALAEVYGAQRLHDDVLALSAPLLRRLAMLRFMMLGEPLPEAVAEGEIGEAEHERAISPAAWAQDAAALMGIATAPLAAFLNAAPSEDSTFLRLQWSPFLGLTGWMRRAADRLRRLAPPRAGALIPRAVAPPAYRLVDLPREYMPLFIAHAQRLCPRCNTKPHHALMCLGCGAFLCSGTLNCRPHSLGGATRHMEWCGRHHAAAVIVRQSQTMLFLGPTRRSVWASLFVDSNGEEDVGMRRGRPLHLVPDRAEKLRRMLAHTAITQDTVVLSRTFLRQGNLF